MVELKTVFEKIVNRLDHPIIAVETGCSFLWFEPNFTNLSSLNIIEYLVKPTNGALYSFDISHSNIAVCIEELSKRGLSSYYRNVVGDSVKMLESTVFNGVNFIWLDSCEDADHAVGEYHAAMKHVYGKHVVCIDDYGCPNSVKWTKVSKILESKGYELSQYDTPTGLLVGFKENK